MTAMYQAQKTTTQAAVVMTPVAADAPISHRHMPEEGKVPGLLAKAVSCTVLLCLL